MQPKLFKTTLADYVPAEWNGKNDSGWKPLGDKVLILPDQAADKSSGGIYMTEDIKARHSMAAEAGVVIALGDGVFKWNSDRTTPFEGVKPAPGDRVYVERYSGQLIHGHDGVVYRVMESACIAAIKQGDKK